MTLEEIELELHQFIGDSRHAVSIRIRKNELSEEDSGDEVSRLIVEKIMEKFFVRGPNGKRGIDYLDKS